MRASSPRRTGPTGFGDFRSLFRTRIPIELAHAVILCAVRAVRAESLCSTRVASNPSVQQAALRPKRSRDLDCDEYTCCKLDFADIYHNLNFTLMESGPAGVQS